MADSNIVNPGDSTYKIPAPTTVNAADLPSMSLDRTLPRQVSTGNARGTMQLGSPNVYVDSSNEEIIVAKNETANVSTPRVLMGNQTNYGEGFYVTKEGIDVTQAKSDSDFIFNSNQDVFKIVKSGSFTTTALTVSGVGNPAGSWQANSITDTVAHNLGYPPLAMAYMFNSGTYTQLPISDIPSSASAGTAVQFFEFSFHVDATNIYFTKTIAVYGSTSGFWTAVPVKFFLLQESVSTTD